MLNIIIYIYDLVVVKYEWFDLNLYEWFINEILLLCVFVIIVNDNLYMYCCILYDCVNKLICGVV